jgi:hypothetical protein
MANILTLSGAGPLGRDKAEKIKQPTGDGCTCHWNPRTKRGVKVCSTTDPKYRSGKRFAGSCKINPSK